MIRYLLLAMILTAMVIATGNSGDTFYTEPTDVITV